MKKSIIAYCAILLAVFSMTLVACGGAATDTAETPATEEVAPAETTSQPADATSTDTEGEVDKSGPEYTAHWICPMHCKGSGSEQKGKCPTCGMDYELNPNHHH